MAVVESHQEEVNYDRQGSLSFSSPVVENGGPSISNLSVNSRKLGLLWLPLHPSMLTVDTRGIQKWKYGESI